MTRPKSTLYESLNEIIKYWETSSVDAGHVGNAVKSLNQD